VESFKSCFGQLGTHQQVNPKNLRHFGAGRIALGVWQYSQAAPCVARIQGVFEQLQQEQECVAFWKPFSWKQCITFLPFFLSFFLFVYNDNKHYYLSSCCYANTMCFPTLLCGCQKELSSYIDIGSYEYHGHPIWNQIKPLNWMNECTHSWLPKS
jgi:hypothetical protein